MRLAAGIALAAVACGGGTSDPIGRLARAIPASAELVVVVDGARLRETWLATAAGAIRALVPADRGCVIDAAVAADRAAIAELAVGRLVAVLGRNLRCPALSQVAPGLWIATLGGATAPDGAAARLSDRPDFAAIRAALTGPVAAVAPDGVPHASVIWAAATITDPGTATLTLELDDPERARRAAAWLRTELAATADRLGDGAPLVRAIEVTVRDRVVTAALRVTPDVARTAGPIAVVAAIAGLAARDREPATPRAPQACAPTRWPVRCTRDGTRFEIDASLRPVIEAAVHAARPAPRVVAGQPAGVRLTQVAEDGVLSALGLRSGDVVIALHGRRLDTRAALDHCADELRRANAVEMTILRGSASLELRYGVQ